VLANWVTNAWYAYLETIFGEDSRPFFISVADTDAAADQAHLAERDAKREANVLRPEGHVDHHGRHQERHVGARVLPTAEPAAKQRPRRLHKEVGRHAHDDPPQLLPGRHRLKKRKEHLQTHAPKLRHPFNSPPRKVHHRSILHAPHGLGEVRVVWLSYDT